MRVLVLGDGDLASEVCEALTAGDGEPEWLRDGSDEEVRAAVQDGGFDVVCVARGGCVPAADRAAGPPPRRGRAALVTIFDPGIAAQIAERSRTAA